MGIIVVPVPHGAYPRGWPHALLVHQLALRKFLSPDCQCLLSDNFKAFARAFGEFLRIAH